jgi:hypothetical protein
VFVRFKHRPVGANRLRSWSPPNEQRLYASLVEATRVDGKPRQRVVRYLAAIREGDITKPLVADHFWRTVDAALAELDLSTNQREAIASKLAATVARPDPADVERTQKEFDAGRVSVASMVAGHGRRSSQASVRA